MTKTAQQAFIETAEKDTIYNDTYHAFIYDIDCMIDESIKDGKYNVGVPLYAAEGDILPSIANYYKAFGYGVDYIFGRLGIPIGLEIRWRD